MIFLDMDGPFADFHAGYRYLSGGLEPPPMHDRSKKQEKAMWDLIYSKEDFFASLPVVDGSVDFYHWLRKTFPDIPHAFLTACPPSNYHDVAYQKKLWVRGTFAPHEPLVIPTWGSSTKPAFLQNYGDVLIDDNRKNCEEWAIAGGKAILFHNNWNDIKARLIREHQ